MRHHLAGMAREVQQQIKFLGSKVNRLSLHRDSVSSASMHEVACLHRAGSAFRSSAHVGAHAGEQFLDAERLGHIIIRAGVEGLNLGAFVLANAEHQHRRVREPGWRGKLQLRSGPASSGR